jgi:HEAT repeat protein
MPDVLDVIQRLSRQESSPGEAGRDNRLIDYILWTGSLGQSGSAAVPVLISLLRMGRGLLAAAGALGKIGPAAATAATELRQLLTAQDSYLRSHAAFALWAATGELGPVIEVARDLIGSAKGSGLIVGYLEEIGTQAAELAPLLLPALSSANEWDQVEAARAYFRLTGDTESVLPVLLQVACPRPVGIGAVEALGWLGHHASALQPRLEGWLSQDERVTGFPTDSTVEDDEKFQEIARTTLAAIRNAD